MSRIRSSRNRSTELELAALFRATKLKGWRRNASLPGKPDFIFPATKLAVFVDGCFWHGHDCGRNLRPKRNASAWRNKITGNQQRDRRVAQRLRALGWRVIRIWECALSNRSEICVRKVLRALKA